MVLKKFLVIAFFALLALPIANSLYRGDLAGCGQSCTVSSGDSYTARDGVSYSFDSLTIEEMGFVIILPESAPFDVANGGRVTIKARNMFISGGITSYVSTRPRNSMLDGANGGALNLIVRDRFELGRAANILFRGGDSLYPPRGICPSAGNGGNGGSVLIRATPSANVNVQGTINVSGGSGATPRANCLEVESGQVGLEGNFELRQDLQLEPRNPVIVFQRPTGNARFGFPNAARSGEQAVAFVSALDQFNVPIKPQVSWSSSNPSVIQVEQFNETHSVLTAFRTGTSTITAVTSDGNWRAVSRVSVAAGKVASIEPDVNSLNLFTNRPVVIKLNPRDENGNLIEAPLLDSTYLDRLSFEINREQSTAFGTLRLSQDGKSLILTPGSISGTLVITIRFNEQEGTETFTVSPSGVSAERAEITPSQVEMQVGDQAQFLVSAFDSLGNRINFSDPFVNVTFSSSNPHVAQVSTSGLLTAKALGSTTVTAHVVKYEIRGLRVSTREIARASARVTVEKGAPSLIEIFGPQVLTAGQSVSYAARVKDDVNIQLERQENLEPFEFIWMADKGVIYPNGTYVAQQAGDAVITVMLASNRAVSTSKTIAVYPKDEVKQIQIPQVALTAGIPVQLRAVALDEFGNELREIAATWSVILGTGTAVLSGSTLTGQKQGEVDVMARFNANGTQLSVSVTLQVNPGAIVEMQVTPNSKRLSVDSLASLSVSGKDKYGNSFAPVGVSWSSSDKNVASVDSSGVVTAISSGTAVVTATSTQVQLVKASSLIYVEDVQVGSFQVRSVSGQVAPSEPVVTKFTKVKITPTESQEVNATVAALGATTGLFTGGDSSLAVAVIALIILLVAGAVYYVATKPNKI